MEWQPPSTDVNGVLAYHPEPILLIHGINANDSGWATVIENFQPHVSRYWISLNTDDFVRSDTNGLNAAQNPYLHTFNYGSFVYQNEPFNKQSFDHIEYNVLEADKNNLVFPLSWGNVVTNPPGAGDTRMTLETRIQSVRDAYSNPGNSTPNLVLVAHSMGGVLSHYYLISQPNDHGVRRLVTLSTPHLGSSFANWLMWYKNTGGTRRDAVRTFFWFRQINQGITPVRLAAQAIPDTAGLFKYSRQGAVEDISATRTNGATALRHVNQLHDRFWSTPAPKIEYVFNTFQRSSVDLYLATRVTAWDKNLAPEILHGDGVVSPISAAGKTWSDVPSIWNGTNNPAGIHDIDPVIFGIWPDLNHGDANRDTNAVIKSICGVAYRWTTNMTPPRYSTAIPEYAETYFENQSFSKCWPVPSVGSVAYTDEPGIADLKLIRWRSTGNPLLVPALNTWGTLNGMPTKLFTNPAHFANHQIAKPQRSDPLSVIAAYGTKNRAALPVGGFTSNQYWIAHGNEYLPASLKTRIEAQSSPVLDRAGPGFAINSYEALTYLDANGSIQQQYGLCRPAGTQPLLLSNNFIAVQCKNLAGFVSPQAERAFDVPVTSSNLVAILRRINEAEALSNMCHAATEPTRWTNNVREWINMPTNGVFTLNFFPVTAPTSNDVRDAWTDVSFGDWSYTESNKTFTLTGNVEDAPSQLIVSYPAHLDTATGFTNVSGGVTNLVPALTDDTLAGLPVTEAFLAQIRNSLAAVVGKYRNTIGTHSPPWTLQAVLVAAGNTNGTWSPSGGRTGAAATFCRIERCARTTDDTGQLLFVLLALRHQPAGRASRFRRLELRGGTRPALRSTGRQSRIWRLHRKRQSRDNLRGRSRADTVA
jgi:pimeloyl-ACP methyl ester carboxylesterase